MRLDGSRNLATSLGDQISPLRMECGKPRNEHSPIGEQIRELRRHERRIAGPHHALLEVRQPDAKCVPGGYFSDSQLHEVSVPAPGPDGECLGAPPTSRWWGKIRGANRGVFTAVGSVPRA